jgi:zinc transport system substrate-binding protein
MRQTMRGLLLATLLAALPATAFAAPKVVVSLKPVHSLVAALMHGVGDPSVIIDGASSPHTYQMKPSDAAKLEDADIIFWVGSDMEKFLEKPLATLGAKARVVELDRAPGLIKLPVRESGTFEPHADDGPPVAGHEEADLHLWLNTDNAKAMAILIEKTLIKADPSNTSVYAKNFAVLADHLDKLAYEIHKTVAPVRGKPFIVFHDAYQYFEREFGVSVAGSITVSPETLPGAARIAEIHDKVKSLKSTCVFAEPQFEPKLIDVVLEGTDARSGVLDPEASTLPKGEALYFDMMRNLAKSLTDCLGK